MAYTNSYLVSYIKLSSNHSGQRTHSIDRITPYCVVGQLTTESICKRNGKKRLLWLGDKNKTLNYSPKSDEMILTVLRWFANKSCPGGGWLYSRLGDLASKVTAALGGFVFPDRQVQSYTVSVKAGRMPRVRRGLSIIWIMPRNALTSMLVILYLMKAARGFIPESSRALEVQPVSSW